VIIGLTGYAQSGKDTVAKILIEEYGYTRISFADVLREAIYRLNPIIPVKETPLYTKDFWLLQDVVDEIGWDEAKVKHPEVRRLLQVIGTEVGRELFYQDVWVDAALKGVLATDNIVVTDVRFLNEADAIHRLYGPVLKIERPGYGPVNNHPSDAGLPSTEIDHVIYNGGSMAMLKDNVYSFMENVLDE
jgi:dephospho-CoA kinase